jgi:hypothetical protein
LIDHKNIIVPNDELEKTSFFIEVDLKSIESNRNEVIINVKSKGVYIEQIKSNFLAPVN